MNTRDRRQVKELVDKLTKAHFDCGNTLMKEAALLCITSALDKHEAYQRAVMADTYQETCRQAVMAEQDLYEFF